MTDYLAKCWVYRRATLYLPESDPVLISYSDGTLPQTERVHVVDGLPVFKWNLGDEIVDIPLNVGRYDTESIYRSGSIPMMGGELRYEYIFGKCEKLGCYMLRKSIRCILYIAVAVALLRFFQLLVERI